jgi:hypothetical protein
MVCAGGAAIERPPIAAGGKARALETADDMWHTERGPVMALCI